MENKTVQQSLIVPALIISVGICAATAYAANTAYRAKALANTISVTGSAEKTITSDVAKWNAGFNRTVGPESLKEGYAQIKRDLETVKGFLKSSGVEEKSISVQPVMVNQNTECVPNGPDQPCATTRLSGYTLRQSLVVESNDVNRVTTAAQEAGAKLADSGIVLEGGSPEFYYSKLADLKLEMLAQATNSARARAQKIVESSGANLGKVVSAGMGVFQVTQVNSTEISDYGTYDTSSVEKKVTAIVRASFTIND